MSVKSLIRLIGVVVLVLAILIAIIPGHTLPFKNFTSVDSFLSKLASWLNSSSQLAQVAPTSGLVAHYTFDDGSGSGADDSVGSNNGTLTNGPTWSAGKIGQALSFDGVNDSVVTSNDPIGTSEFSFSAWVYPRSFEGESNRGTIFSNGRTALRVSGGNGAFQFSNDGFTTSAASTANAVLLNNWQLVTVTRNSSGTVNIYVNGTRTGTSNQDAGALQNGTSGLIIGDHLNVRHLDGVIDDVRIYNRVLSQSEIAELYNYTGGGGGGVTNDTTSPTISNIEASNVTSSGATISWTTNESADRQVEYGLSTSYGSQSSLSTSLGTSHSRSLSNLSPNTLYHYRVKSRDAAGNLATSPDQTFTTANDTSTPSDPISFDDPRVGASQVSEWGINITNRSTALGVLSDAVLVSANSGWSLALRSNGTLYAWGSNATNQLNVPSGTFKHANAGWRHGIAVRTDGSIVEWGQALTEWPGHTPNVTNAVQVAAGDLHSAALLADGTVLTWGDRTSVTSQSGKITNAVAIASGWYHMLVLLEDGTVVTFGEAASGQNNTVPAGLSNVVKIAAGPFNNIAIKADGTMVAWGLNNYGQSTPPSTATNIIDATSGRYHTLALKSDGTVIGWGDNTQGQLNIPTGLNASMVGAGYYHSLAIGTGGTPPVIGDVTLPIISSVQSSALTSSSATITWTTNEASDTQIEYGLTTAYGSQTALNTSLVTSHTQAISNLLPNTTYNYRVKSKDASGNLAVSANRTFSTSNIDAPVGNRVDLLNSSNNLIGSYGTIQECADAASAGQTCLVHPGTYARTDVTKSGTTGSPITFQAQTGVISNGFWVRGSHIKITGFTFTGNVTTIGDWMIGVSGDNVEIAHNTFTGKFDLIFVNSKPLVFKGMIGMGVSDNNSVSNGWVHHNTIANWIPATSEGSAILLNGSNNLAEFNTIKNSEDIDTFEVFGSNNTIRNNIVQNIIDGPVGTHIDFVQVFGDNGAVSYNTLIENNIVENFEGQIAQLAQSCGLDTSGSNGTANSCASRPEVNGTISSLASRTITDNSKDWIVGTWQANHWNKSVVSITSGNALGKIYIITANTSNTLTVANPDGSTANLSGDGVTTGSTYEIRNRIGWWTFKNNVFKDVALGFSGSIPHISLLHNTYINTGGIFSGGSANRGRSLNGIVQGNVHISTTHIYGFAEDLAKATFNGDYNFVSTPPTSYAKKDDRCSEEYAFLRFCEASWPNKHGVNGGDPLFVNINNVLGPDEIAWTNDDGLRPKTGSPLCGKGPGGVTIGAYNTCGGELPPPVSQNCSEADILCVDDTPGSTQEYATIQLCANAADPGDTCLVHAGNYPEYVETKKGGTSNSSRITFKANGNAVMEGFWIRHEYVTVEGFDITKYGVGTLPAYITVDRGGSFCSIKDNTIHDGVQLLSNNYSFNANSRTITIPSGGLLAAGFEPGVSIYIASNIANLIQNHDQVRSIKSLTDTTIVLDDTVFFDDNFIETTAAVTVRSSASQSAQSTGSQSAGARGKINGTPAVVNGVQWWNVNFNSGADGWVPVTGMRPLLITEGPVHSLLYVTRSQRSGVGALSITLSSQGIANNCVISGNTISNIAGNAVELAGTGHVFERNTIEQMNGWRIFGVSTKDTVYRYNHIRNSPRYAGFEAPPPGFDHNSGTFWDFYAQLITSFGNSSIAVSNNTFEYNLFENMDSQFVNINDRAPGSSALPSKRFVFRNNVIYGLELPGAFHRPESIVENNTFYKASFESDFGHVFNVSDSNGGVATDSIVRNNAFVENGTLNDKFGWYSVSTAMAEPPNWNFVAGPASLGYPAKAEFAGDEPNGVNGGNPLFQNVNNPVGPDGILFTSDDGLKPLPGSPLCSNGKNGTYIGAYPCGDGTLPMVDTTAPILSQIAIVPTRTTAVLTFSTNELATSRVSYGGTAAYGTQTVASNPNSVHTHTLANLLPGILYHLQIAVTDAAGNTTTSQDITFTTPPPADTVKPTVALTLPLPGAVLSGEAIVTATAADNVGVVNVEFYLDDTLVTEDATLPFTATLDTALFSNGGYSLTAVARDAQDNTQTSAPVAVTITNAPSVDGGEAADTTAPSVPGTPAADPKSSSVKLTWSAATDNIKVTRYVIYRDGKEIGRTLETHYTDRGVKANTAYRYTVKAYDLAGNASPESAAVTTTTLKDEVRIEIGAVVNQLPPLTQTMRVGSRTAEVKILQEILIAGGYLNPGLNTGYFGPATLAAVKKYQCAKNITCGGLGYGVVGPKTRERLNSERTIVASTPTPTLSTSYTFTRTLRIGSRGEDVRQLQIFLNSNGFTVATIGAGSKGKETAYFGPATGAAVRKFQDAYRAEILTPSRLTRSTGIFGPSSIRKANSMLGAQPVTVPVTPTTGLDPIFLLLLQILGGR